MDRYNYFVITCSFCIYQSIRELTLDANKIEQINKDKSKVLVTGFVQVLENLESPGIL